MRKKSAPAEAEALFSISVLVVAVALEALAAVHGAVALGLEGHLGGAAAAIADHFIVLALGAAGILAVAASGAALMATGGVVLSAKNCCSDALNTNSLPQSRHTKVLSSNMVGFPPLFGLFCLESALSPWRGFRAFEQTRRKGT